MSDYEKARENLRIRAAHVNSAVGDEKLARFLTEEQAAYEAERAAEAAGDAPVLPLKGKAARKAEEVASDAPQADGGTDKPVSEA